MYLRDLITMRDYQQAQRQQRADLDRRAELRRQDARLELDLAGDAIEDATRAALDASDPLDVEPPAPLDPRRPGEGWADYALRRGGIE